MLARLAFMVTMVLQLVAAQQCHKYVIVSVRGTSEPQGPSMGFVGMINQTLTGLAGGIEYDAVYPASLALTANLGGDDVHRYITAGVQSCPEQTYALLGYSQGASASAIGLRNFTVNNENQPIAAIRAIVVIGNPGHEPNAAANVDQLGGKTTTNYTGSFYYDGAGKIPDLYYDQNKILDICFQGDPICAPGYPNASFTQHVLYGGNANVQSMGAKFLIEKLSATSPANSTATPGGSTTSPTGQPPATTSPSTGGSWSMTPSWVLFLGLAAVHVLAKIRLDSLLEIE